MKTIKVTNRVFLLGLLFAFIDQLSKVIVQSSGSFPISLNEGIAFSIPVPLEIQILLSSILIILIVFFSKRIVVAENTHRSKRVATLSLGLILGGGLGNLMDRINLGHVIDFIDVGFWPVFNLADSFVCIGATLLAVLWLKK